MRARYSDVRFNEEGRSLAGADLIEFLRGRRCAITALERIDEAVLQALPELEVISKVGVGIDMLDLDALSRHNVRLGWSRGTNARSVAELVIALALATLRHIPLLDADVRIGGWEQRTGSLLTGKSVGILGFGAVGREVAKLVTGFQCPVLAHDVIQIQNPPAHVRSVPFSELLEHSDVVTIHVAQDTAAAPIIDRSALRRMRQGAILINTARGSLVDEDALTQALATGPLRGAALDVFAREPPENSRLLDYPNVVVTPHIGGSTEEAILAMGRAAIDGLRSARPIESVNASSS